MNKIKFQKLFLISSLLVYIFLFPKLIKAYEDSPPEYWQPESDLTWQIQFNDEINLSVKADVYEIDLDQTYHPEIGNLVDYFHEQGAKVICYISVGSYEDWREDAIFFPSIVLGNDYEGWEGEKWLDIRQIELLAPIILSRFDKCAKLDFDGIEADNISLTSNNTGFKITKQNEISYAKWLAQEAHSRGLAIGQKNGPNLVKELLPHFDFVVIEDAFYYEEAYFYLPYIDENKPVFAIEYTDHWHWKTSFCEQSTNFEFSTILKHRDLDAWVKYCP